MKKIAFLLSLVFAVVLLAGCQGIETQPTATAVPEVEPVAETTKAPSLDVEAAALGALTVKSWQWVSFTDPLQQFELERPENYLLTFNQDGTVAIKADCNNAMGSYTTEAGSLKIEVGPMTLAACPPESRSDEFVANLGYAARYFFEDGFLYIDLFADGGTMAFAPAAQPEAAGDVTSHPWLWTSFTGPVEQFEVDAPDNYVVTFNDDGTLNIKADCNNAMGSYTADAGGSLKIEVGPMTKAACPPESRSDQFVQYLGSAARYFFEDAELYIDLFADGGTMRFAPEGEAEWAEAAAQPEAAQPDPTVAAAEAAGVTLVCSAGDWTADCADGPRAITGEAGSGNFGVSPNLFPNPTAALIDVTNILRGQPELFVSEAGQILGIFTKPLFPMPGQVRINLPMAPTGASLDMDNDGQEEAGIQVYALAVASNIILDSYLQQLEQGALSSYLMDAITGVITEGTFLIYAPDAEQGFPAGAGADGQWFTADDPTITLPTGYTVAILGAGGTVTLDRSPEVAINTIEPAEQVSPDFADQGLLESFHSLIDTLKERYAYTELRNLDWEEIRAQYLPEVEQADADQDIAAYYLVLDTLARSLKDTHVAAVTYNPEAVAAPLLAYLEKVRASVGASTIAVFDETTPPETVGDQIVVLTVGEDTPAEAAGWVAGTEIVSIDGEPASARLQTIPLLRSVGTETVRRVMQAQAVLNFPEGQTVTIGYRLPAATDVLTATMVAGPYDKGMTSPPEQNATPVTYEQVGDYAVVRWSSFSDFLLPKIAVLEEALAMERSRESGGVILDLRGNTGGWATLYQTMASYFFTADDPMPTNVFDWYSYDLEVGKHIRSYAPDYRLSAPRPELAYSGPVVVLVDEGCASACEYFAQHLQVLKRATVIGQYPSSGAGGPIDRVQMPGNITFQFTKGKTTFAGTDEPNLEAKGVVPDIRVPVTVETEQARMRGEDPVLEAALAALPELAAQRAAALLTSTTWQWTMVVDASSQQVPIEEPTQYTVAFAKDGALSIKADCNQAGAEYALGAGGTLTVTLGATTLALCPEGSLSEDFLKWLGAATTLQTDGQNPVILLDPASGAYELAFEPFDPAGEAAAASDTAASDQAAAEMAGMVAALTANPWKWTAVTSATEQVNVETPDSYMVTFKDDGTVEIKADCNNAFGTYTLDGDANATIAVGPATLAACPGNSRSEQFLQLLGDAAQLLPLEGKLYISLKTEGSMMILDAALTTVVDLCGEKALAINEIEDTLDPKISATLDEVLVSLVQAGRQPGPGASMLIVTPGGRYFKSTGVADVATCEPLAADSPYQIGSNTKMMTSAILFQLQEEGVLKISDPLSKWLPDLAAKLPNGDKITIDMMLTHTSGLHDYFDLPTDGGSIEDGAKDKAMLTRGFTPEELVTLVADSGLSYFAPGAEGQWHYSNTGYMLLGLIIEKVTGKSYEENLRTRILEPLGLTQTYLQAGEPEPGTLPQAYYKSPFDFTTGEWNASQGWAAGAVVSTPKQFAVFLKALFTGELYRQPSTLDLMKQHTSAGVDALALGTVYAHGMLDNEGVLGHGGQTLGFQSDGGYIPDKDVAIVIWSNSAESNVSRVIVPVIANMVSGAGQ